MPWSAGTSLRRVGIRLLLRGPFENTRTPQSESNVTKAAVPSGRCPRAQKLLEDVAAPAKAAETAGQREEGGGQCRACRKQLQPGNWIGFGPEKVCP